MTPRTLRIAILALAATAAIAVAGCGSGSSSSSDHGAMNGMNMNTETQASGHAMGGQAYKAHQMGGMTALVAGADGTRASAAGLTLRPQASQLPTGRSARWAFTIRDAHGMAVTRFERDQTKLLHLIVVRSDLTGYQHVHPTLGKGARFTIPITLPQAGRYRAIADFTTAGKRYALGTDLTVPGTATSQTLPPAATSTTTDGYSVMLDHGDVRAGKTTTMAFTITRGGQPVTALQPYLGAYGHLVAQRHPDIAYSHVHPVGQQLRQGTITFDAELPTAGTYRLFVQFRAGGQVHTRRSP